MKAEQAQETDLYARLHVSPDASDEEIRKAYRQWAQVYHPDKYQTPQMKDIATENFQRIRDAYGILSDENKRQIYDIYGMEGLNSGLELGPTLKRPEEIKEELERLQRRREQDRVFAHARPTGSVVASFSLPGYLIGHGIMKGMAMVSELQSQVSKRNTLVLAGNLEVSNHTGTGAGTALLRHQVSPVASIEFMATAGLRSLIGIQTSRHTSLHSTATAGLTFSLRDGSVVLSNTWTRHLSEAAVGNIQLVLGTESSIAVGWQKRDEKASAAGEVKFGTSLFGASGHYTHHFSSKSHGRVACRIGSTALDFEIGGGRRISDFSTVRMLYNIGIQGIFWRFEFYRGGQKLIIPILLSKELNSLVAASALIIPSSLYFLLKTYIVKPYYLRRERRKALENMERSSVQVGEAREAAKKAQKLLENVSNRKKNKQLEKDGLVITRAIYGNLKIIREGNEHAEVNDDVASQVLDVTLPLNFLVTEAGQLKLHEGIKKSGIMGFCDPCPGEPKQLLVEYTFSGNRSKVVVDDNGELLIP